MAKLAASGYDHQDSADGESYIEKYIKSVAAVESIITLDRLGQVNVSVVCVTMKTGQFNQHFSWLLFMLGKDKM